MAKTIFKFSIILMAFLLVSLPVKAEEPYVNYNYDYWKGILPSAPGYKVKDVIHADDVGVEFQSLEHIFVTDDNYYIVDSKGNKVIIVNKQFQYIDELTTYDELELNEQGVEVSVTYNITNPQSVFVTDEGDIYIADTDNKKVILFNKNLEFVRSFGTPDDFTFQQKEFKPYKVVVDDAKRIYITVRTAYEGIIELASDGEFNRYVGVQEVQPNFLDLIWRRFMTDAQRAKQRKFFPTEYTDVAIDNDGFIYATATSDSQSPIQRLNPKGIDVLRDNGYYLPSGDISRFPDQDKSSLVSIDVNDYGMYSVLDQKNGRIFTYNDEGYLTYVTGMKGELEGTFTYPTSLAYDGEELLVTDSTKNTITIFEPTDFGEKINTVARLTYFGDYVEAAEIWEEVLEMDANYSLAYVGIGNSLYRNKEYKKSMEAFELGQDREGYSKAFKKYRKERAKENFPIYATIVSLVIGYALFKPMISQYLKELKEDELYNR